MKQCTKCKEIKELILFFKHSQTPDRLHSWCKSCCNKGSARSRDKLNSTIEGRATVFLQNAKKAAIKRGHLFELTITNIVNCWEQQKTICAYSGRLMTLKSGQLNTVSIERIDSKIGYTIENTVLVCQAINRMKSDFEFDNFYNLCRDVAKFLGDKQLNLNVGAYK